MTHPPRLASHVTVGNGFPVSWIDSRPTTVAAVSTASLSKLYQRARISERADNSLILAASNNIAKVKGSDCVALDECPASSDLVSHRFFRTVPLPHPSRNPEHCAQAVRTVILTRVT